MEKLDQLTKDGNFRAKVASVIETLQVKGYKDTYIVEAMRTVAQQREKVKKGVSKTMNSYHLKRGSDNKGLAADIVPKSTMWSKTGKRYWFMCPWYKGGVYCGKRVGVLYMDGKYFACRHCYELTYNSRNLSGWTKPFGAIISEPELEELEGSIKRWHYRGKPTKRYQRFLKKREKANRSWMGFVMALSKRCKDV